jgi:RNA polymerase sigma-70 factor (ECF subfamily)
LKQTEPEKMSYEVYEQIEEHLPSIRRYAHALEKNPHAAEDLIQDCVERALTRHEQFQAGTNLRTWLFTIMHNLQCDRKRKDVRRGVHVPLEEWSDGASTPGKQTDNLEMRDFRRAFGKLDPRDQQIMILIGMEGMSYEETAEVLEVKVGTVKSRLFRARERLRAVQADMAKPRRTTRNREQSTDNHVHAA